MISSSYRFTILLTLFFIILASTTAPSAAQGPNRPDIILILTDDQPWHTMQFMPLTNQLLGGEGVTFSHAYVSTPYCCPSRASILTGQYAHKHGTIGNDVPFGGATLFDDSSTIATWMQNAGYRTGLVGKYLNEYFKIPLYIPPGWDQWFAFNNRSLGLQGDYQNYSLNENGTQVNYNGTGSDTYSTNVLRDKAIGFISSTPADQPLFLYFATSAPHTIITPDPADVGKFEDLAPYRPPSYNEPDVSDKPAWLQARAPLSSSELSNLDELYRLQALALQPVDRAVEAIVQALEDAGRLSNAVIIYTTDNGYALADHRLTRKNCVYEICIKVPLLVRAPGLTPRVDSHLVQNIDLPVTIADFAGITPPTPVDGVSFADLLYDPNLPWRDNVLIEVLDRPYIGLRNFQAVHTSQYVYAEYANGDLEFYDLTSDPDQLENQSDNPAFIPIMEQLSAQLGIYKGETNLSLSTASSSLVAGPGNRIILTYNITNQGPLVAAPVTLDYYVPPQMRFVSCQPGTNTICDSEGADRWVNLSILRPGETKQVQIVLESETGQQAHITAEITAFTPLESDPSDNLVSVVINPFKVFLPLIQQPSTYK